jgi:hypothetical protein
MKTGAAVNTSEEALKTQSPAKMASSKMQAAEAGGGLCVPTETSPGSESEGTAGKGKY